MRTPKEAGIFHPSGTLLQKTAQFQFCRVQLDNGGGGCRAQISLCYTLGGLNNF
jgi:hypothetical protein